MPKWLLPVAIVLFILAAVFLFLTQAPWLQVKDIRIDGNPTEETKEVLEQLRGENILWLSVMRPEAEILRQQPSIKSIQILRGIPDTLRIKLIEREPAIIWETAGAWYTVDSTGFIYSKQELIKKEDGSYDYPGTDLPVVIDSHNLPVNISQTIVRPLFITFVADLKQRLKDEAQVGFVRAEVGETTFNVAVITDAKWKILFDTTRTLDAQMKTLTKILESRRPEIHEYVDVRVRGRVFYK